MGFVVVVLEAIEQVLRRNIRLVVDAVEDFEQQVNPGDIALGKFIMSTGGQRQRGLGQ